VFFSLNRLAAVGPCRKQSSPLHYLIFGEKPLFKHRSNFEKSIFDSFVTDKRWSRLTYYMACPVRILPTR